MNIRVLGGKNQLHNPVAHLEESNDPISLFVVTFFTTPVCSSCVFPFKGTPPQMDRRVDVPPCSHEPIVEARMLIKFNICLSFERRLANLFRDVFLAFVDTASLLHLVGLQCILTRRSESENPLSLLS